MRAYQRGKIWYIDFRYKGRRIRRAIGRSKREAELALKNVELKLFKGEHLGAYETREILFREFAQSYLEEYCRGRKTHRSYLRDEGIVRVHLSPFFGEKYLSEITPYMIERYKTARLQEVKVATVNRELRCLQRIFAIAVAWDCARENPCVRVRKLKEPPGRTRYLKREEINRLLDQCVPHVRSIVMIALNTGMRLSEILNLMWDDVDLKNKVIFIRNSKNNESRGIPMNGIVFRELKTLRASSTFMKEGYVFSNKGRPFTSIKTGFKKALRRAGIEDCRFHDLRHTFASHLVMSGCKLRTVQQLLGHKDIKMTARYSHLSKEHLQEAVNMLGARLAVGTNEAQSSGHADRDFVKPHDTKKGWCSSEVEQRIRNA